MGPPCGAILLPLAETTSIIQHPMKFGEFFGDLYKEKKNLSV